MAVMKKGKMFMHSSRAVKGWANGGTRFSRTTFGYTKLKGRNCKVCHI